jgi:hypothetical protein
MQSFPGRQKPHRFPCVPHWLLFCAERGTQVLPLQQPFGQLDALQTHCPCEQACPAAQALQLLPPLPHCVLLSLVSATHSLPLQQPAQLEVVQSATHWPPSRWKLGLQLEPHAPPLQLSVALAGGLGQRPQALPPAPQLFTDSLLNGTQLAPLQQPLQPVDYNRSIDCSSTGHW